MTKQVRTARGEVVDFDAIQIKQQLAQAPMNIEVQRRKEFIDTREGRARGQRKPTASEATVQEDQASVTAPDEQPKPIKTRKTK